MPKLKVVFDTNVVISNLWPGVSRRALGLWRDQRLIALTSEPIIQEYLEVLARFPVAPADMQEFVALFTDPMRTLLVHPHESIKVVVNDPSDDKFLECAVAGNADMIVSGDKHLKLFKSFRGIPILSPSALLERYKF